MGEQRCVDFGPLAKRAWGSLRYPFVFARKCEELCERCRGEADWTKSGPASKTGHEIVDGWTLEYECTGRSGRHQYKCALLVTRMDQYESQQPAGVVLADGG